MESLSSRSLLSRLVNRQNPVNDSDSSSVSSGGSHSVPEDAADQGLAESTSSVRPSTSAGRNSRSRSQSHSVFAEVHQSTEILRRRLELQHRPSENQLTNRDLHLRNGGCVRTHDDQSVNGHDALGIVNSSNGIICGDNSNCELTSSNILYTDASEDLTVVIAGSDGRSGNLEPDEDNDDDQMLETV